MKTNCCKKGWSKMTDTPVEAAQICCASHCHQVHGRVREEWPSGDFLRGRLCRMAACVRLQRSWWFDSQGCSGSMRMWRFGATLQGSDDFWRLSAGMCQIWRHLTGTLDTAHQDSNDESSSPGWSPAWGKAYFCRESHFVVDLGDKSHAEPYLVCP